MIGISFHCVPIVHVSRPALGWGQFLFKTPIQKRSQPGGFMQRRDVYSQAVHIGGASPRETEILAFGLCNARLGKATDVLARIDALHKTHQLWSLLVRDLAGEGNQLPQPVKESLLSLGFWAMGYSVAAAGRDLPLLPLIEVNQNMIDGLRAQVTPAALGTPGGVEKDRSVASMA